MEENKLITPVLPSAEVPLTSPAEMPKLVSSPTFNLARQTFATGEKSFKTKEGLKNFKEKIEGNSHSEKINIEGNLSGDNTWVSVYRSKTNTWNKSSVVDVINLPNLKLLSGNNKTTQNLLDAMLYVVGKAITNKVPATYDFSLSYEDLASFGIASSARDAKKMVSMQKVLNPLLMLNIGHEEKSEGDVKNVAFYVLFPTIMALKDKFIFRINPDIPWDGGLIKGFFPAPSYFWKLDRNPKTLLFHICDLVRIKKTESFTLSLRTAAKYLALPLEKETRHPTRDIKDQLILAVDRINAEEKKFSGNNKDLKLKIVADDSLKITDWLDKGVIKVTVSGRLIEPAREILESQKKKIAYQQRKKRSAEIAVLSKKMAESEEV